MEGKRAMSSSTDWARGGHRIGSSSIVGDSVEGGEGGGDVGGLVRVLVLRLRAAEGTIADSAGSGWPSSPRMVEGRESYETVVRRLLRVDEEDAVEDGSLSSLDILAE